MHFNKAMIDLVQEIRRRSPSDTKPAIKLANPDIFYELTTLFKTRKDTISNALIKELFELAGDPWPENLKEEQTSGQRYVTQVYRGQTKHIPVLEDSLEKTAARKKPQKIYRGRVVAD